MRVQQFSSGLFDAVKQAYSQRAEQASNRLVLTGLIAAAILTVLYIVLSILIAPPHRPAEQFEEGGTIGALSAIYLAMGGTASLIGFYVLMDETRLARFFWLIAGLGMLFLSLDELVQIHEAIDSVLMKMEIATPDGVRNWNDVVVILYGIGGLAIGLLFLPEVVRYRHVLEFFGMAFAFYVVHTLVDSMTVDPTTMSVIIEESAKLMCVMLLMLAGLAGALAIVDERLGQRSP